MQIRSPSSSGCRRLVLPIAAAVLAAASTVPAAGQVQFAFELSFSNPGARSMGLGGAFVALADDATAAFANPAGLVQLAKTEISIEGRSWSYSTPYTRSGRASGRPTDIGIDTEPGIRRSSSESDLSGVSFVSAVLPRKRWALAFYRHQLAGFESAFDTQGLFADGSTFAGTDRLEDVRGAIDLEIVTYGVAGSWRINDHLSVGLGLSLFDGQLRVTQDEHLWDDDTLESFFAENSFLPRRRRLELEMTSEDEDLGLSAGFLWRLSERCRLGGFFRQGPDFDGVLVARAGPLAPGGAPPGASVTVPAPITYPDVYGLGVAFRPRNGRLTLSFEWDRVDYSVVLESLSEIEERDSRFTFAEFIDDGDELHLGAEYAFLEAIPLVSVRLGAWLDPDHRVATESRFPFDQAIFIPGDDEIHYAVGLGARFERFQVDVGADFSELRDTVSASAILFW